MNLASDKISYVRALEKLFSLPTLTNQEVQQKVLSLIVWNQENKDGLDRDTLFEIQMVQNKIQNLWIQFSDFEKDYKTLLAKTFPNSNKFIPASWVENEELSWKYSAFIALIERNPEWWNKWKYKIDLVDDGIIFDGKKLSLKDSESSDFTTLENWEDFENAIPSWGYFITLWKCLKDILKEDREELLSFFGLKADKYWTSSKWGLIIEWFAYFYDFWTLLYSYTLVWEKLNVRRFK